MKPTTYKPAIVACVFAGLAASGTAVLASDDRYCGYVPRAEWKSISEVHSAVEAKGYQVREIERDDGCYEVYVRDQSGKRYELYLNPRTLQVVKTERGW